MKHSFLLIMLMFSHSAFSTDCPDFSLRMKETLNILEREGVLKLHDSFRIIDDEKAKKLFNSGTKREDLNYCRSSIFRGLDSCWKVSIHKDMICSQLSHTSPAVPSFLGPSIKFQCRAY